jgi:hypothetical protein
MIMARTTVPMVVIGLGVRHAFRMGGNFPVFVSVRGMRHSQEGQSDQPENTKISSNEHGVAK